MRLALAVAFGLDWMGLRATLREREFGSNTTEGVRDGRTVCHHEGRRRKVYVLQPRREGRRESPRLTCPGPSLRTGDGEAMSTASSLAPAFDALGNVLLLESTPGRKDLWKSICRAEFECVAQKAEFLL